jgi:enamine deaminase RidA (YjgF/YER057c/UK114 family)
MVDRVEFLNPPTLHKPVGYSHVATVRGGKMVFIAGQVAIGPDGEVVGPGDHTLQAEQTFRNLGLALEAAGGTWHSLVKLTIFVIDIRALPEIRSVRDRYVDTAHPPASTAVQVSKLFRPDLLLEVEAVAVVGYLRGPRAGAATPGRSEP